MFERIALPNNFVLFFVNVFGEDKKSMCSLYMETIFVALIVANEIPLPHVDVY